LAKMNVFDSNQNNYLDLNVSTYIHTLAAVDSTDRITEIFYEFSGKTMRELNSQVRELIIREVTKSREHIVKDARELEQYDKYNKMLYTYSRKYYLFLGQGIGFYTLYDLIDNRVMRFRVGPKPPEEVINYLVEQGKATPEIFDLPPYEEDRHSSGSVDAYCEIIGGLTRKTITFDTNQYYGQGEAGRGLSKEQELYIRETLGYRFR